MQRNFWPLFVVGLISFSVLHATRPKHVRVKRRHIAARAAQPLNLTTWLRSLSLSSLENNFENDGLEPSSLWAMRALSLYTHEDLEAIGVTSLPDGILLRAAAAARARDIVITSRAWAWRPHPPRTQPAMLRRSLSIPSMPCNVIMIKPMKVAGSTLAAVFTF